MPVPLDEDMWNGFRAGNVSSFEMIYDKYASILYQYGRNYSGDRVFIEDCVQELFTELWGKKANLSTTTSIRFYLFSSLRRKMLRKQLQKKKRGEYEQRNPQLSFHSVSNPESDLILNEDQKKLSAILLEAINSLPERQREVLYLRYYAGFTFDEITAALSIPKKTAYNIIFKALESLRKKLNRHKDFPLEVFMLFIESLLFSL